MLESLIIPVFGALAFIAWMAPAAWAMRPANTHRADAALSSLNARGALATHAGSGSAADSTPLQPPPHRGLADAKIARALTRNGLLSIPLTMVTGFLIIWLFFTLSGWLQIAWGIGILITGYAVCRTVLLWPTAAREQQLHNVTTAYGMKPAGPPWTLIGVTVALLAVWFVPPLFF